MSFLLWSVVLKVTPAESIWPSLCDIEKVSTYKHDLTVKDFIVDFYFFFFIFFFLFNSPCPCRWNSKKFPFAAKKQVRWWYQVQVLSSTPFFLYCNSVLEGRQMCTFSAEVSPHVEQWRQIQKRWVFFVRSDVLTGLSYVKLVLFLFLVSLQVRKYVRDRSQHACSFLFVRRWVNDQFDILSNSILSTIFSLHLGISI